MCDSTDTFVIHQTIRFNCILQWYSMFTNLGSMLREATEKISSKTHQWISLFWGPLRASVQKFSQVTPGLENIGLNCFSYPISGAKHFPLSLCVLWHHNVKILGFLKNLCILGIMCDSTDTSVIHQTIDVITFCIDIQCSGI